MSINFQQVQGALRAAIGPPEKPSQDQVLEICKLTYLDDARKEIQRMLDRRLKHPDAYELLEIFNTLVLIQRCLPNASTDFVDFCNSKVQLVIPLSHYGDDGTLIEREQTEHVRKSAISLSKILLDPARLADDRRAISATYGWKTAPPPTQSRPVPLPTPPSSPQKQTKPFQSPLVALQSALPSPDPTPPKSLAKLAVDDKVQAGSKNPNYYAMPSTSVFFLKKEDVAMMTFRDGSEGLETILGALNDLLKGGASSETNPNDLVKALTCVHHCLYWGSAPFVARCREMKIAFTALRKHSIAQVRGHADAIVNLLNDSTRLQEERRSRASLMPTMPTSPSPQDAGRTESIRETPGRIIVLEPVLDISKYVIKLGQRPVAGGGYSDVWKGEFRTHSEKEPVAIKYLRRFTKVSPERLQKRLNRELHVWRSLLHENITPFYGIVLDTTAEVGMVSPWYNNGNALEHVKSHQNINPLRMLQGIVDGVAYLHAKNVVHGDLKCANVMVNSKGTPKLIDFGLAQIIDEFAESTGYTTSNLASSLRWSAPELLIGESPVSLKTDKSDVYAFASTCIEIMTLECPYQGLRDPQVLKRVTEGAIPDRPSMEAKWSPCDELWVFLKTCWRIKPQDRPNIVAVKRKLAEFRNEVVPNTVPPRQYGG